MKLAHAPWFLLLVAACSGSGEDVADDDPLPPPAAEDGFQFRFDVVAPPQTEVWKCVVGPIPGTDGGGFLPVHKVHSRQSSGMHHMDIMVLAGVDIPDGEYDCDTLYADYPELMEETVIYAAQSAEQIVELPPGVVANVPAAIKTLYEIHYVNTGDAEETIWSRVNAYTIEPGEVTDTIWGNAIRDRWLNVAAGAETDEWMRCVMTEDVDVLFLSTHTHQLGYLTEVFAFDGETTGAELYRNEDWTTPLLADFTTAPLHVPAGAGFETHCHYRNTGLEEVHWGFAAADEMCNLALVYVPGRGSIDCTVVETSDGMIVE
jgi:hypothetical protein